MGKIFCKDCKYKRDEYCEHGSSFYCAHDACFEDTPNEPLGNRLFGYGDEKMNQRNQCKYFEAKPEPKSLFSFFRRGAK